MATRHTTDFTPNPRLSMNIMRFWENLATYLTSFGGNFSHNFIPLSFLSPAGGPARRREFAYIDKLAELLRRVKFIVAEIVRLVAGYCGGVGGLY